MVARRHMNAVVISKGAWKTVQQEIGTNTKTVKCRDYKRRRCNSWFFVGNSSYQCKTRQAIAAIDWWHEIWGTMIGQVFLLLLWGLEYQWSILATMKFSKEWATSENEILKRKRRANVRFCHQKYFLIYVQWWYGRVPSSLVINCYKHSSLKSVDNGKIWSKEKQIITCTNFLAIQLIYERILFLQTGKFIQRTSRPINMLKRRENCLVLNNQLLNRDR